jgi:hypothetical protein
VKKNLVIFGVVLAAAGIAVAVAAAMGSFDSGGGTPNQDRAGINGRARIYLVGTSPMSVRGAGFRNGERVRVTAKGSRTSATRTARAGATGAFLVRLGAMNGCDSVTISAIGDKGSRTSLNISSFLCRS